MTGSDERRPQIILGDTEPVDGVDSAGIVAEVLKRYRLRPHGTHGVVHWARVLLNGLELAERTGADRRVVALFALFHDARRINEGIDDGHGARGAKLAITLRERFITLEDEAFEQLLEACRHHTAGRISTDPTIQACWDADRLDLLRVGIEPDPWRLGSGAARALVAEANKRARERFEPQIVSALWTLPSR